MKTKNRRHSIGGVIAGLLLFALGCSDGVLPTQPPELPPSLSKPLCKSFTAVPSEVERGGAATLAWEVELADKVEIAAGGDNPFRYETTEQFRGETPVSNIQETTVFILTAFNSSIVAVEEGAQEGEEEAAEGMHLALSKAEEEEGEGEEGEPGASTPAVQSCQATVRVTVRESAQALAIQQFYAEDDEVEAGSETKLHWTVVPDEAQVSIASSAGDQPVVVPCDAESTEQALDEGEVSESYPASGCASVTPTEETAYTLTATFGNETETQTITVYMIEEPEEPEEPVIPVAQVDCSEIQVTAPAAPVFSGEEVKINWNISGMTASNITSVRLVDNKTREVLKTVETGGENGDDTTMAARSGLELEFVTAAGEAPCSKGAGIVVASLTKEGTTPTKAVKVVKDPASATDVYIGLDHGGFNEGKISYYHSVSGVTQFNFFDPFKAFDDFTGALTVNFMNDDIGTFPVNAATKGSDGTLFVATTGVILYKKPEGDWTALTSMLLWGDEGQEGTHASCFGKEQTGRRSRTRDDIVSMSQFCDLEVAGDKLYAATDKGLFWLDDVNGFIDGEGAWQGLENNPTDTHVVNDVLIVGSDVYAATSIGVFKNGTPILDGVYANSVAVVSDTVVVGGSEGVYVNGERKLEGNIYSVAIDPYDPRTIYAAGAGGFYVSRDGGESFTQVAIDGLEGEARSVAVLYSTDPREEEAEYRVYLATESGIYKADLQDVVMGEVTGAAEPAEVPEEEEVEEPGEETETPEADDEFHGEGSAGQS
ncbi:MAG: hypothetical protein HY609_04320 [Deltaproteobacteria bacterium]|nr:hypothetical protein [Deltaproteobacteria bacterium]MBI4224135.1 hypothetical protein [Deltaproteobacteria bacterium]